jgi:hypothetical protein
MTIVTQRRSVVHLFKALPANHSDLIHYILKSLKIIQLLLNLRPIYSTIDLSVRGPRIPASL